VLLNILLNFPYSYPLRIEVQNANAKRLDALEGNGMKYIATDIPGFDIHGQRFSLKEATLFLDKEIALSDLTLKV